MSTTDLNAVPSAKLVALGLAVRHQSRFARFANTRGSTRGAGADRRRDRGAVLPASTPEVAALEQVPSQNLKRMRGAAASSLRHSIRCQPRSREARTALSTVESLRRPVAYGVTKESLRTDASLILHLSEVPYLRVPPMVQTRDTSISVLRHDAPSLPRSNSWRNFASYSSGTRVLDILGLTKVVIEINLFGGRMRSWARGRSNDSHEVRSHVFR